MTARWMVRALFHENLGAVPANALICLPEDGVQRLDEVVEVVHPAEAASDYELHSLDGVAGLRCPGKVDRHAGDAVRYHH